MSETILTMLSNSGGFPSALPLLQNLHDLFDTAVSPEKRKALALEMPKLISGFPELSKDDLISYVLLLSKIFDLLDYSQMFTASLLLLNNLTFDFCTTLNRKSFSRFRKLLIKLYTFTLNRSSEFSQENSSFEAFPLLLLKGACYLVAYTSVHHYPAKLFPSRYSAIRQCLIAALKSNRLREKDLSYVKSSDVGLAEWLGLFGVLEDLRKSVGKATSDLIGNWLYFLFNDFLCRVLGKKREEFMKKPFIAWTNQVVVWVAAAVNNFDFKVEKLSENLNTYYFGCFSKRRRFKKSVNLQLMSNPEFIQLKVFKRLHFTDVDKSSYKVKAGQKSQVINASGSLSEVAISRKRKHDSTSKASEEIKSSSSSNNKEDTSSSDELFKNLSDSAEAIGNLNESHSPCDDTLAILNDQLNMAVKQSCNPSVAHFEEEEKKLKDVNEKVRSCIKRRDIPGLSEINTDYLYNELETFILEYIEQNNKEMKEKLSPFYDHFLHNLKVSLEKLYSVKFGVSTWSNCNETYFVGGEELCISVYSYYDYHPVTPILTLGFPIKESQVCLQAIERGSYYGQAL
eukprot:TRINITY_DN2455_c0_g1_i2.p1 TRINITY_DN2455_c0_g1~~TRINITY_DN2455_c0_g1_i2.p1  ORF type:complete len:569 (-),score=102.29 TRINITY_DN2455_c0_g1_i2:1003-2709(-)